MKKLFLLDGMALIYRAHFALSKTPRFTSTGINTSAVMGFANTLMEVLRKEQPTHIAVVFDTDAPTERHVDFEAYKAHRQAMPEDLVSALPYVFKLIEGFNIPVITKDGFEADDIIGTLAKEGEKKGFQVFCMTPDKDFAQLVSENIFIYKPSRMGNGMEILGVPEVLSKWEIENVKQVIDILGLWGDAVDNIPGIPGIGEKTSKILIKQYGSVENIIANAHELKGKMRENVEMFAEQGLVSKKLATIILDVPVDFDEEALKLAEPSRELLEPLFAELEFRTLGKRVFGESFTIGDTRNVISQQTDLFGELIEESQSESTVFVAPPSLFEQPTAKTIADVAHDYKLVDTPELRAELIELLLSQEIISWDTETTGTDANLADLVGLSFCIEVNKGYYIPLPADRAAAQLIIDEFRPVLENEKIGKIGQNIKYDILILKWYDVHVKGTLFDTMIAHYLIDPDTRHNMDLLSQNYLGYSPISITTLIGGKGKSQVTMREVPVEQVVDYAAEDADVTLQLANIFRPMLTELNAQELAEKIENPLIYVLADIEKAGVRVDVDALNRYSKE
ncbi:MAG: polymerase, partial [Pedobacter sp.]|nr:polymerase [Pedobacter sp.]